jgi:hypothetical protein
MRNLNIFILIFFLIGCGATAQKKKEVSSTLGPDCYALFTAGGPNTYGACNFNLVDNSKTCAFAYATDGQREACSWVSVVALRDDFCLVDCLPTQTELEAAAIARCETNAKARNVQAPCKIFAKGYDIVYEKNQDVDFQ